MLLAPALQALSSDIKPKPENKLETYLFSNEAVHGDKAQKRHRCTCNQFILKKKQNMLNIQHDGIPLVTTFKSRHIFQKGHFAIAQTNSCLANVIAKRHCHAWYFFRNEPVTSTAVSLLFLPCFVSMRCFISKHELSPARPTFNVTLHLQLRENAAKLRQN